MADKYISIKQVLDDITAHPLLQDISFERAINYTIDFMRLVCNPSIFEEKTTYLKIDNYRSPLPCDFNQVIQVRLGNNVFKYSSDSFHFSNKRHTTDLTYKIQGGYIYTSIENGSIELAYLAIALDEEGFPLIPDNSSFTRALELYIKKNWFTVLFDLGKISPAVLQNTQQEYAWAVGDCQTEFNRLTLDKAESFYNSWGTLVVRNREHSEGFKHNNVKEKINI